MTKCALCHSRKGKRKCLATGGLVCSVCCGDFRDAAKCGGCTFFKPNRPLRRDYRKVPHYPVSEMANNLDLETRANSIESAICRFALDNERHVTDATVIRLLELLMDHYAFLDAEIVFRDELEQAGFEAVDQAIEEDLAGITYEEVAGLLATIYRSAKRRTCGGREYLDFIDRYVGYRIGPGIRAIPNFLDLDEE